MKQFIKKSCFIFEDIVEYKPPSLFKCSAVVGITVSFLKDFSMKKSIKKFEKEIYLIIHKHKQQNKQITYGY